MHACLPPPSLQRTFREIMFLQELNNHENIIRWVQGHTAGITCLNCMLPLPLLVLLAA